MIIDNYVFVCYFEVKYCIMLGNIWSWDFVFNIKVVLSYGIDIFFIIVYYYWFLRLFCSGFLFFYLFVVSVKF